MKRFSWLLAVVVLCQISPTISADEDEDKSEVVKKVEVKGLTPNPRGRATKPTVIQNEKDLAKAMPNKEAQESFKEQVDLAKQNVLLFSWAGSGQDKIEFTIDKKEKQTTVYFEYKPGRTRDLRPHVYVFAIEKTAKVRLGKKP